MSSGVAGEGVVPDMDVARVCFTDKHEVDFTKDEARATVEAERTFWNLEVSQLQLSLEEMSSRMRQKFESGRGKAAAGSHQVSDGGNNTEGEQHKLATTFPTLIPGLPTDLAEICLARVPWVCQPKLMTVCKTWAAYLMSDHIFAVRCRHHLAENLLVVLSVPVRLGPLRLTVFDVKAGTKLEWHKPLAVFDYLGRWSGFLRGFRCAVVGPYLFIIGGRHDGLQYATGKRLWRFNFITRKWMEAAPMHVPRRDFACAVINNKVYVAGGTDNSQVLPQGHGTLSALNSAEVYDFEHDQWDKLPHLEKARVGCLGVALEDRFYVIGGGTDNGTVDFELFRSAEVFDTSQLQWKIIDNMWQSHVMLPRAVAGFDDSLFAVDSNDQMLKSYDEMSNHWSDVMPMPFSNTILPARIGHAERQQAMGGLPGDQLIHFPREGLFWMGPCSFQSSANHLLRLRESRCRRGWSGNVAKFSEDESPSTSTEIHNEGEGANRSIDFPTPGKRACLIIGSSIVYV